MTDLLNVHIECGQRVESHQSLTGFQNQSQGLDADGTCKQDVFCSNTRIFVKLLNKGDQPGFGRFTQTRSSMFVYKVKVGA